MMDVQKLLVAKKNMKQLNKFITIPVNEFNIFISIFNFLFKKINNNWCKCLLSGFKGDSLFLIFLIIEKKFS